MESVYCVVRNIVRRRRGALDLLVKLMFIGIQSKITEKT